MAERFATTRLSIEKQYVRSLTYEAPDLPGAFEDLDEPPDITARVGVEVTSLDDEGTTHEVVLRLMVTGGSEEEPYFVIDLSYAAVVELEGLASDAVAHVLHVEVPGLLFPFARNLIAAVTADSGFAPVLLDPIRFTGLPDRKDAPSA